MLERCYSSKCQAKNPTYKECTVIKEWLTFSNFAAWHELNCVKGYDLDKDIKVKGNKVYGPESCLFIPKCINYLLTDHKSARGDYPQGVSFHKSTSKYRAQIRVDGKVRHIGVFTTPEQASAAYIKAKNSEIKRKCEQYPEFAEYLIKHLLPTK